MIIARPPNPSERGLFSKERTEKGCKKKTTSLESVPINLNPIALRKAKIWPL